MPAARRFAIPHVIEHGPLLRESFLTIEDYLASLAADTAKASMLPMVGGKHPGHVGVALWDAGSPAATDFILLRQAGVTHLNAMAGGSIEFRIANDSYAALNAAQLFLHNNKLAFAAGGGWFMQDTTWVRTIGDKSVYIGGGVFGCQGGVSVGHNGTLAAGTLLDVNGAARVVGSSTVNGQVLPLKAGHNSWGWTLASVLLNAGAVGVSIGFHPGTVAGQLNMAQASPYYRFNGTATELYPTYASEFLVGSAGRTKQDIEPWPRVTRAKAAAKPDDTATGKVKALRVVSFKRNEAEFMAEVPDDKKERKDKAKYKVHKCKVDKCGGTDVAPCEWRLNWQRGEIGLLAEEVEAVLPEAVMIDNGEPAGISLSALLAAALVAVQELTARVEALEGAK